jgi:hypothetical protein
VPETVEIVLSIFGLIGIGYAAVRFGIVRPTVADALAEFVFVIAVPVLLFRTLATADFSGSSPWRLWTVYFVVMASIWILADRLTRRLFGFTARRGLVAGMSATYANLVLIGIPLVDRALGEEGMIVVLLLISIHTPLVMFVTVVANEWLVAHEGTERRPLDRAMLWTLAQPLVTNPILIAVAAGAFWRIAGIPLTGVPATVVDSLARVAGPIALFSVGAALVNYGIGRQVRPAILLATLKLLLMPALVLAGALAVGLPPRTVEAVTLLASTPTGVNAYIVASRFGTGQALASNTLLYSTAAAIATVGLWLVLLRTFVT